MITGAWTASMFFVAASDRCAVRGFEQGALDYIVKPVEVARLGDAAGRLGEHANGRGEAGASPR
jgi:DNA-binding LytR/AlgR family response regulator